MLAFAIAAAGTAVLGLLARVVRVQHILDRFGGYAGLFMQLAGVLETVRRLGQGKTFNIVPAAPTVSMAGSVITATPVVAATKAATMEEEKYKPTGFLGRGAAVHYGEPGDSLSERVRWLRPTDLMGEVTPEIQRLLEEVAVEPGVRGVAFTQKVQQVREKARILLEDNGLDPEEYKRLLRIEGLIPA